MVYLLYNKFLLRVFVLLTGAGIGVAAWHYVALSALKLPEQGARDALAIISFLVAAWLVMLIAEVLDNHYARVFGCLCVGLGAYVSYPWVFRIDGPKLAEVAGGQSGMQLVALGFWGACGIAAVMLLLLVWRLVLDRLTYGRPPLPAAHADVKLGPAPPAMAVAPKAEPDGLPPIPIDTSPLLVSSAAPVQSFAPQRAGAPVKQLTGIGGMCLGTVFAVQPGQHTLGRSDAELLLADDNQVSRRHAQLNVEPDGLATLSDLGSTNGTFVNNQRIQSIQLCPGDVVQIGTSSFKVEG
jgi:hypothetical protein